MDLPSDELIELWLDFEHGRTKEGLFVKELDKIEMCLQALAYEKEQDKDLTEFFAHTCNYHPHNRRYPQTIK